MAMWVQHAIRPVPLAGVGDDDALAVAPQQGAGVARLAAALWIEHRPIELDAVLAHCQHARGGGLEIRIVPEQQLGGHGRDRFG